MFPSSGVPQSVSFRAVFRRLALAVVPVPTTLLNTAVSPIPHLNIGAVYYIPGLLITGLLIFSPYDHHTDASDGFCNHLSLSGCNIAEKIAGLLATTTIQLLVKSDNIFRPFIAVPS